MVTYYCERLAFLEIINKSQETKGVASVYKRFVNALYVLNILWQALFNLLFPIGLGALGAFLLTKYTEVGGWIWAVLMVLGAFTGLFSMVKFILSAMAGLERLEKEQNEKKNTVNKNGKQ